MSAQETPGTWSPTFRVYSWEVGAQIPVPDQEEVGFEPGTFTLKMNILINKERRPPPLSPALAL